MCEQSVMDPGLFIKKDELNKTIGIIGLHVDDFLHAGSDVFEETVIKEIHKEFLVGKCEKGSFMYTGFSLSQKNDKIILDQSNFVLGLCVPTVDAKRSEIYNKTRWV